MIATCRFRRVRGAALALAVVAATIGADSAWAGGRGGHGGGHVHYGVRLNVGVPLYGPWYGYGPHYYPYPRVYAVPPYYPATTIVAVPSAPTTYVERVESAPAAPVPEAVQYWYYCRPSRAYYPYVRECASEWERVSPQPR